MTAFPRTIASAVCTPPEFPDGMEQWGMSGKGQFRSTDNVGRMWQEIYRSIDLKTANARALMRAINQAKREKIIWTIQHPHYKTNYGTGGGTPLVDGASQTGSSIDIKNAAASVATWLRDGDIIQIAGSTLVLDVAATVITDSAGDATISIHPPIFAGQSPVDEAAVTIVASNIWFSAVLVGAQMPDIESHGVMGPGLTLLWREQPSA